jgi:hypothetical protein
MTTIANRIRTIRRRRKAALDTLKRELALWSRPQTKPIYQRMAAGVVEKIKREIADIENFRVNFCD